jgi:arabinofuranosyltransferase
MDRGERVTVWGANGLYGFVAGPRLHIIDRFALGDALLARLPAEPAWYAGHVPRRLPDGYRESVAYRRNAIVEPGVHALYERIRLITQAPVFSPHRLHAIWRLNTDGFRNLLEGTTYAEQRVRASEVGVAAAGSVEPMPLHVHEAGVVVELERQVTGSPIEITVDGNDDFFVDFRRGGDTVGRRVIHRAWTGEASNPRAERVAPPSPRATFDRVLIRPRRTWGPMNVWRVRLL